MSNKRDYDHDDDRKKRLIDPNMYLSKEDEGSASQVLNLEDIEEITLVHDSVEEVITPKDAEKVKEKKKKSSTKPQS